jgi:indole-3-glycerol phosphate synthase
MATGILNKIVSEKRQEVEQRKRSLPTAALKERIAGRGAPLDFKRALSGGGVKLIAEVKKASPSRGIFRPDFDPLALARSYAEGGAAAISVLTEENHFQGSLEHMKSIREEISLPLLRKDFLFDEYQIYESAAYGADALLLISAILSLEQLKELLELSLNLGIRCLVEVHNEKELERTLTADAEIIGINNRDLNTFKANIDTTRRLCSLIPSEKIVVSESGIRSKYDIVKLKKWGVNAVLVGESLVTAVNIPVKIKELLK